MEQLRDIFSSVPAPAIQFAEVLRFGFAWFGPVDLTRGDIVWQFASLHSHLYRLTFAPNRQFDVLPDFLFQNFMLQL